jgi:hypothetical protein
VALFKFKRPEEYPAEAEASGGVAVIEAVAEAPPPEDLRTDSCEGLPQPFREQIAEIDRMDSQLRELEQEHMRLDGQRDAAIAAVQAARLALSRIEEPQVLVDVTDSEIEERQRSFRGLLREQGRCERELENFVAVNGDLKARRESIQERKQTLEKNLALYRLESQWFDELQPELESVLLRLAGWCELKTQLNRDLGVVTRCGVDLDPFPGSGAPLREHIRRIFGFERALFNRGPQEGFARPLEHARNGTWPSRPAIVWR